MNANGGWEVSLEQMDNWFSGDMPEYEDPTAEDFLAYEQMGSEEDGLASLLDPLDSTVELAPVSEEDGLASLLDRRDSTVDLVATVSEEDGLASMLDRRDSTVETVELTPVSEEDGLASLLDRRDSTADLVATVSEEDGLASMPDRRDSTVETVELTPVSEEDGLASMPDRRDSTVETVELTPVSEEHGLASLPEHRDSTMGTVALATVSVEDGLASLSDRLESTSETVELATVSLQDGLASLSARLDSTVETKLATVSVEDGLASLLDRHDLTDLTAALATVSEEDGLALLLDRRNLTVDLAPASVEDGLALRPEHRDLTAELALISQESDKQKVKIDALEEELEATKQRLEKRERVDSAIQHAVNHGPFSRFTPADRLWYQKPQNLWQQIVKHDSEILEIKEHYDGKLAKLAKAEAEMEEILAAKEKEVVDKLAKAEEILAAKEKEVVDKLTAYSEENALLKAQLQDLKADSVSKSDYHQMKERADRLSLELCYAKSGFSWSGEEEEDGATSRCAPPTQSVGSSEPTYGWSKYLFLVLALWTCTFLVASPFSAVPSMSIFTSAPSLPAINVLPSWSLSPADDNQLPTTDNLEIAVVDVYLISEMTITIQVDDGAESLVGPTISGELPSLTADDNPQDDNPQDHQTSSYEQWLNSTEVAFPESTRAHFWADKLGSAIFDAMWIYPTWKGLQAYRARHP